MFPQTKFKPPKYQKYLNVTEIFTKEEIKNLKKINPDISNLFKASSNKNIYNNKDSYLNTDISKDSTQKLILKKKFFSLILEEIKKEFERKKDSIMSKIISLLINEIITISKIVRENQILNEFFNEFKNDRFTYFEGSKKFFNNNKTYQSKKEIFSKSEQFVSNGSHIFKKSQPKKNKIIQNASFTELNNLEKSRDRSVNNTRIMNTDNGINISKKNIDVNNNKNNNGMYYSFKKLRINEFKKNNKTNSKPNKNKLNCNNSRSLILMDYTNSNTEQKITLNNKSNNKNNSLKKKLIYFQDKYKKNQKKFFNRSVNKKDKEIKVKELSIIEFINSNTDIFNTIETENFNIFEFGKRVGKSNVLPLIGYYIFNHLGFYDIINFNKFEKWSKKIDEGYSRSVTYHTNIHASDITQTCLVYFKLGKINEICNISKNSKCSLFLSCLIHDYKHPGVNNNYLKETKDPLAILYNDSSILENMHLAEMFKLTNSNAIYNIFDQMDNNSYKQMRKEMISCVLATDMVFHNNYVDFMKRKKEEMKNGGEKKDKDESQIYMNLLIHSADISNPTKPFDIYFEWAKLVVNEFYEQGDKEKELGLVCSCDRNKVTIYQSQLGFINYIELAFFSLFVELFPNLKFYYDQLNNNKTKLISMEEEEKKKKENINNNL